jgi:glyoxylase-like metal-dependent hydrolase (beta-lactamase superfamily II)
MRILKWTVGTVVLLVVVLGGYVYSQLRSLEVEQITEDLYVLYGLGGNVAVLNTDEGTVIVDSMTTTIQGARIREEAERLTGKPISLVINTHYHLDHTHGNPAFAPGTRVVSTEKTLHLLEHTDAEYFSGEAASLKPNDTFTGSKDISMGNKTLRLINPGPGHTGGDLVVVFVEDKALHTGDLFFHRHYPNIDLEGGGSVAKWGDTLDNVLALPFNTIIPGHGKVTDRPKLEQYQRFMRQLAAIGIDAAKNGTSLEATIASDKLTEDDGYTEIQFILPIGLTREFVLQRSWEEANNAFELIP